MASDHSGFKALGHIDMDEKTLTHGVLTVRMTNKSGGTLNEGDVVIIDPSNDKSVKTTTTAGYELGVWVIRYYVSSSGIAEVIFFGYIPKILTTAASGTGRGQFLKTSTTAKKAQLSGTSGSSGDFAVAITNADANGYLSAIFKTPEVY